MTTMSFAIKIDAHEGRVCVESWLAWERRLIVLSRSTKKVEHSMSLSKIGLVAAAAAAIGIGFVANGKAQGMMNQGTPGSQGMMGQGMMGGPHGMMTMGKHIGLSGSPFGANGSIT
jgi:hypothetical protein